jgi:hypothetical protein
MSPFNARTLHRTLYTLHAVLFLALLSGCGNSPSNPPQPTQPSQPTQSPPKASPKSSLTAVIYLIDSEKGRLKGVKVPLETEEGADVAAQARYVLTHYLSFKSPDKDLTKPFPPGTKLLDVQIKQDVAHADFSKEYKTQKWWGGTDHAYLALRALVNTLTEFKGVNKVQILVEGQKLTDADCGGIEDLSQPLERDDTLIDS